MIQILVLKVGETFTILDQPFLESVVTLRLQQPQVSASVPLGFQSPLVWFSFWLFRSMSNAVP